MTQLLDSRAFDSAAATHVGKVRTQNEDNFIARPEIGLWCVADGMGGHDAGGLASAVVVELLRELAPPASPAELLKACEETLFEANRSIRAIAAERRLQTIGTTVVLLLVASNYFACLWSGDSRVYRVRRGVIEQISRDHSEVQEMIDSGALSEADARNWPRRNVITRAIGVFEEPELELRHGEVEAGDTFVLCSDGLTGHVEAAEIASYVVSTKAEISCGQLIDLTLERGASDNVTVAVVRYQPEEDTVVMLAGAGAGRG